MSTQNIDFEEILQTGLNDETSPFIKRRSHSLSKHLSLTSALLSGFFLLCSFLASFTYEPLSYLLLLFVYFLAGTPALIDSLEDLKKWDVNIDVLMTMAAFFSVLIGSPMEGALLLVLFALSGAMEEAALSKTSNALQSLHKLSPSSASVLMPDGSTQLRSIKDINPGETIAIKAGDTIPLDGKVVWGESSVDLAHLTGESIPKYIGKDMEVPAGARNIEGALNIQVTKKMSESTVAKIIHLITEAAESKPQSQRLLDRFGKPYSMTIIILSAIFALTLPLFSLDFLGPEGSIYRALAFLIAASPCALIIATPTAYLSSISSCARKGILLKGGVVLDDVAKAEKIAFDKTGTITTSKLIVSELLLPPSPKQPPENYMKLAASLESHSTHPMALAIMDKAHAENTPIIQPTSTKELPGVGLEGSFSIDGKNITATIGHTEHILSQLQDRSSIDPLLQQTLDKGLSLCALLVEGEVVLITFTDQLKEDAHSSIQELKEKQIETIMLTGDHQKAAMRIANECGLDQFFADLKPEDKLKFFDDKPHTLMVGDGINDAPALAKASVGISMGSLGSDSAIEASDVVLLSDQLALLPWLIKKAKKTRHIVIQNLFLSIVIIILASMSALLGIVPLWLAVILHEGGTICVALNGLRLLRTGGPTIEKAKDKEDPKNS